MSENPATDQTNAFVKRVQQDGFTEQEAVMMYQNIVRFERSIMWDTDEKNTLCNIKET